MTWALCLNCGDIKFGAICPCPMCQVETTGDHDLDITFSDHTIPEKTLRELGAVVRAIHEVSDDPVECYWAFLQYVSVHHPSILTITLEDDMPQRVARILDAITILPPAPKKSFFRRLFRSDEAESPERARLRAKLQVEAAERARLEAEEAEQAMLQTEAAIITITQRALAAGIGTPETVSALIYNMSVQDFRNLTDGFPNLSRVDFNKR